MNIDIINIGHYRASSHGGRAFDLFNRETDQVYNLNAKQFCMISLNRTVEQCQAVEDMIVELKAS